MQLPFPNSFYTNTVNRMIDFLNESNRIEGITQINYYDPNFQTLHQGHFGALIHSQQLALEHEPLSHRHITYWQSLLTREQVQAGHHIEDEEIGHIRSYSLPKNVRIGRHIPPDYSHVPTLLTHLIEEINEGLKDQEKLRNDAEYSKFLGRSFQKFESIHPFCDGNGRTGRLLAAYIATFCGRPIVVFQSDMSEKNNYYQAHETVEKMTRFMAKKIQEAIFGFGQTLLNRIQQLTGLSAVYQGAAPEQTVTYEWHSLRPLLEEVEQATDTIQTSGNVFDENSPPSE